MDKYKVIFKNENVISFEIQDTRISLYKVEVYTTKMNTI